MVEQQPRDAKAVDEITSPPRYVQIARKYRSDIQWLAVIKIPMRKPVMNAEEEWGSARLPRWNCTPMQTLYL